MRRVALYIKEYFKPTFYPGSHGSDCSRSEKNSAIIDSHVSVVDSHVKVVDNHVKVVDSVKSHIITTTP